MNTFAKRLARISAIVATCYWIVGCVALSETPPPPPVPRSLGYQCLPVPSSLNSAGSVIVVFNGEPEQLGQVSGLKIQSGEVGFPTVTYTSVVSSGLLLNTLESLTAKTQIDGKLNAETKSTVDVTTSYGGDVQLQSVFGETEVAVSKWFTEMGYKLRSGRRYFLVREAVQATQVNYEIKRTALDKIGGEARVKNVLQGTATLLDQVDADTYRLNSTFKSPVNVCIRPVEILPVSAATGDNTLMTVEVQGPILGR